MTAWLLRGLLLTVVLAPLPLGSNREWAWSVCMLVVALLALSAGLHRVVRPGGVRSRLPLLPATAFLGVCAWAWLQSRPWLPAGWAHPVWGLASEVTGEALEGSVSVSPQDTLTALMRLLGYGLVFVLAFHWCRDPARARTALTWISLAGVAYAVYGLTVFWTGYGTLPWFDDPSFRRDVRGTFVNRNHFATWLGLCLMCALALYHQRAAVTRNPAYRLPRGRGMQVEQFMLEVWKPLTATLFLVAALILTHSRAGFASAALGGAVLLVALNYRRRILRRRSKLVLGAAVILSLAAFWLTSEVLLERMDRLEAGFETRLDAYGLAAEGIEDSPLLGYGYGTFADSFRLYRDERLEAHFDKAHNTYLENVFELGWPAAAALFFAVLAPVARCLRGLRERHRDWVYPATALAASALVGVHAMFDFSLQIPAVAITYACILGVGASQSRPTSASRAGQ